MAAPATPLPLSLRSQERVVKYASNMMELFATSYNIRNALLERDKAYYRENDQTVAQSRARSANRAGDSSKIQNVTIPVVMPQVESALADLQETFLSGYPIFGVIAPPGQEEAMEAMETQIGENSIRAAWPLEFLQAMRNGLKYDFGPTEVVWEKKKIFAVTTPQEGAINKGAPQETWYEGNFVKCLDPYNTILDCRVAPEKNHVSGEFAGYTEIVSRIEMKKRMADLAPLGCMNFAAAMESAGPGTAGYGDQNSPFYIPAINPDALMPAKDQGGFNWLHWMGETADNPNGTKYSDVYEWQVLYCRILPSDFLIDVPSKNTVQIWKFIVINRQVVIFSERQTNAHNYLPIVVCKPSADSLGWQSKSFSQNGEPFQSVATSLVNSGLASQRRKVYDRIFYDPTRINKKDIDDVSSVARIPIKSNAYGKPITDAVHESPYRDEGVAEVMGLVNQFLPMADLVNGRNRVQQGQFQKGNKTRKEFDTTMGAANARGRMQALALEYSYFAPIKEIIKSNMLQYQQPGKLVNSQTSAEVAIDPQKLRAANLSFQVSDGYLPSDKMVSSDMLGMLFQAVPSVPSIMTEFDLMGMMLYSMQLQGGGWMRKFRRTPEQQQQQLALMQQSSIASGTAQPPAPAAPTGAPA